MMRENENQLLAPEMIIDWQLGDPALTSGPMVAAIGNFDGVHIGHQQLIAKAKEIADADGLPLAIITFTPHPRAFFRPNDPAFLLQDPFLKNHMLAGLGVSSIIQVQFDEALQHLSAEAFVSDVLGKMQITHICAGADFAFGKGRAGTMESLSDLGAQMGMQVTPVHLLSDEHASVVSSSRIRAALQAGQVDLAAEMLGRPMLISGQVIEGDKRGRTLGFPTANIMLDNLLVPALGVYAVDAWLGQPVGAPVASGVCNIGRRPTVNDRGILAETHLFDFDQDIYEQRLTIALKGYIRAEVKFSSLDALQRQIAEDVEAARSYAPSEILTA